MTTPETSATALADDMRTDGGIAIDTETVPGTNRSRLVIVTPLSLLAIVGLGVLVWFLVRRRTGSGTPNP